MSASKRLSPDEHFFLVEKVVLAQPNQKHCLVLKPYLHGYQNITRSWTPGSASYESASKQFGAIEPVLTLKQAQNLFTGKIILGNIEPSKTNPGRNNLVKILKVFNHYPEKEISLYLKGFKESFNRENTNETGA